ncbi:MAG TPA: nuclear transport factor 2 family protein [Acidimicrobiia bacterium]|nr:nuclear transport factor 2 family protein [Acidimicrobiia bacterium]
MSVEDKLAVAETLYRYARGVDTRDWDAYRAIFTDRVTVDFSGYDANRTPVEMAADDWVAQIRPQFTGLHASQHAMTNPLVEVNGDRARVTMYVRAHHVFEPDVDDSWYTVGGFYENELVRSTDAWLLTRVKLTVTWRMGRPEIMGAAREAGRRAIG